MRSILTHLWFPGTAGEAAALYASVFPGSRLLGSTSFGGTPDGEVSVHRAVIAGEEFQLLSAGAHFSFTPAISFMVFCENAEEVDRYHAALSPGGSELMPLGGYDFSPRYAWVVDRYGLSWQLFHAGGKPFTRKLAPTLMYTGRNAGKAAEAIGHYTAILDGVPGDFSRYGSGSPTDDPAWLKHGRFSLLGRQFAAMDSGYDHGFGFNEAISFLVTCDTQEEIDATWTALSADPSAEQCGWLKDRYGLSWQIVPAALDRLMSGGDEATRARVTAAFLAMRKFDIAALEKAARGD